MNPTLEKLYVALKKRDRYDSVQTQSHDSIVGIVGQSYDVYYAMENHHEHALMQEATKEYHRFKKVLPGLRVRGFVYNGTSLRGLKYKEN